MSQYLKSGDFIGGSKFLNDVRDSVASGQPDAMGVLPGTAYGGGLTSGDYLRLNDAEALQLSDTSVGTLWGGVYRRVYFKSGITGGGTTGFKRGQIVFWDLVAVAAGTATDPYQVTNVEATDSGLIAGIVINATDTAGAPLSGFYGWIQVAGLASVVGRAALTTTTALNYAVWAKLGAGADNGAMDVLIASTGTLTLGVAATGVLNVIGQAVVTAVNSTPTLVQLYDWRFMQRC